MTVYYVRKDGNDGTGNGSTGNPWLTVTKAWSVAGAGDNVKVADGVYAEDTLASGYWQWGKNLADWLTTEAENGAAGNVVITGTTGSYDVLTSSACSHLRFNNLTFGGVGASYAIRLNNACDSIEFNNCRITPKAGAGNALYILDSSYAVSGLVFNNCQINPGNVSTYGVLLSRSGTGSISAAFNGCTIGGATIAVYLTATDGAITFTNCTITATTGAAVSFVTSPANVTFTGCAVTGGSGASCYAYSINGASNITITGGTATNGGNAVVVQFGADAETGGNATTGSITGTTVSKATGTGHALLVGNGASNFVVDSVTCLLAYDYAVVIKENTGTIVRNCNLVSGSSAALCIKAAVSASITGNIFTASQAYGVRMVVGGTGNKSQNVTLTNNRFKGSGSAACLLWMDSTGDLGGGVCDYNKYRAKGSGGFGTVVSTSGITTLGGQRAAWAGYGDSSNDSHSQVFPRGGGLLPH